MDRFTFIAQEGDVGAEDCMDVIRALVGSGEYNAVFLNSVAGLSPKKEMVDDLEKAQMALNCGRL